MTKQFDVVENQLTVSKRDFPFLLILQNDLLDDIRAIVVAPVRLTKLRTALTKLSIELDVEGQSYKMEMQLLSAFDRKFTGKTVANIMNHRKAIIRAHDIILSGILSPP